MLTCFPTLLSNSILQHPLLEDSTAQGALKRRSIVTQFPVLVGFGYFGPPCCEASVFVTIFLTDLF